MYKQNTSALDTQPTVAAKLKRLLIIALVVMPTQGKRVTIGSNTSA